MHVLHVFPSFGIGGVPIRIAAIINGLGSGFRHTIIALDNNEASASYLEPEADYSFCCLTIDKKRPLQTLALFRRTLAGVEPDLLATYNWGAIEWGLVNMLAPVCRHIHFESGFGPEEIDWQLRRRVLARRLVLLRTEAVVVPSRTLVELAREQWKISGSKIRYIPNGVDCERFAAPADETAIAGFKRRPGELIIGTLAPLRREKNIARLLRAFASLEATRQVRLLIVGDGPERGLLEQMAGQSGIADRVLFAGHIAAPEKVLGLMDIFALSSDTEQMPNTLLQAMAAGRAVASVEVGDIAAILSVENRPFVTPRGDDNAFRNTLARLLADQSLRAKLGQCNQARVKVDYDLPRMLAAYRAIYQGQNPSLISTSPS